MSRMFKKILIANRGEIAVRVIRACREMGIIPVAIYSDADRKALHVRLAEEAYYIGEAKPQESYLHVEKIIGTAKSCRAEAVHPGYGFLAENPRLVKRCEEEGIIFIGPPSEPMEVMGEKTSSRRKMSEAGVPIIPGTLESVADEKELRKKAREIGFPLLLKASLGGGGKGLRLVKKEAELVSCFKLAQSEALSSFADPSVYVEKYIEEPHHIEIQILADNFGKVVYLGERECSLQRRYQKVLEETPSPFLDDQTRKSMGQVAIKAASSIGYRNAGTVEFIVDKEKKFYFLEMNARLQVEHPITEMVTGIDLVKCQLEIAAGCPLTFSQGDIKPQGHAMECRIMAEDPFNDFMPSPGKIVYLHTPAGLGVRDDSGIYEGYEVPLDYDPLLSKLITWGKTREEVIRRMLRALAEYQVYGIKTTIPFFQRILLHPEFIAGHYNTHFISELDKEQDQENPAEAIAALIAAGIKGHQDAKTEASPSGRAIENSWKIQGRVQNFSNRL
jgi:acetyl-CoA carboxylase, biotin carboxylase subunit